MWQKDTCGSDWLQTFSCLSKAKIDGLKELLESKIVCMYVCMYVCLLITLTCSPKAELRRVQLNGIGRMHMKGASGCHQTVMNYPGAQQLSQMFYDLGKGQTTTPGAPCPTPYE